MSDVKDTEAVEETESTEDSGDTQAETKGEVDYAAELERLKENDRKKTGALREEREKRRDAEKRLNERDDTVDEDALTKIAKKVLAEDRLTRVQDDISDILETECTEPSYRKLVKYHYENTINHSGESKAAIRRDIANAKLLANKSKYVAEAKQKAKKSEAEKAAFVKDGSAVRTQDDSADAPKGTYVGVRGDAVKPQNAAEKKLLDSLGVKKN